MKNVIECWSVAEVPMNKVQVGSAPSPNLKTVRSKIGSLDNASYKPGGGKFKIENRKLDFSKTQPKIAAKNDTYVPGGGDKKVSGTETRERVVL
jgi:microtubule-associated protein tau